MTRPKDFLDEMVQSRKKKNRSGKQKRGSAGKKSKTSATPNLKQYGCLALLVTKPLNGRVRLLALSGQAGRVSVKGLFPIREEQYSTMAQGMMRLERLHNSLDDSLSCYPVEPTELAEIYSNFREICCVVSQETEPSLNKYSAERIAKVNLRMKSLYKSGNIPDAIEKLLTKRKR
jgi:hypothetical protein